MRMQRSAGNAGALCHVAACAPGWGLIEAERGAGRAAELAVSPRQRGEAADQ